MNVFMKLCWGCLVGCFVCVPAFMVAEVLWAREGMIYVFVAMCGLLMLAIIFGAASAFKDFK